MAAKPAGEKAEVSEWALGCPKVDTRCGGCRLCSQDQLIASFCKGPERTVWLLQVQGVISLIFPQHSSIKQAHDPPGHRDWLGVCNRAMKL